MPVLSREHAALGLFRHEPYLHLGEETEYSNKESSTRPTFHIAKTSFRIAKTSFRIATVWCMQEAPFY